MSEAPERVYMDPDIKFPECDKRYGCDVEYVRTDLCRALVAGAYEAAARQLFEQHPAETAKAIRALTDTNAQSAIDALIRKAVNAKLEEVAALAVEWAMRNPDEDMMMSVFSETILAMKETE